MGSRLEKNSKDVSKRIQNHDFQDEGGEEYEGSKFGGFSDYMRRKKIKLQNLDSEIRSRSSQNPQIFKGIVAHVNGYTQPSLSDLHNLIVSHGGGFLQYLEGKTACTHIIASQLTPKKKAEFAKYRIVKPSWIVDSVEAGRILPWDAYRVVDEGVKQKVLGFENGSIISQANSQRHGYRNQTDTSWYTSQVRSQVQQLQAAGQILPATSSGPRDVPSEPTGAESKDSDGEGLQPPNLVTIESPPDLSDKKSATADLQSEPADDIVYEDSDDGELMKFPAGEGPEIAVDADHSLDDGDANLQEPEALTSARKRQLTAEEHNEILLQNPHLAKSSTANPDFINQYYRESRLHHLSAWKADLKSQLQARAQAKSSANKSGKRTTGPRRYILHVDFDSFFAAVSLRQNPHLVDKPVVIAHGSGPGSEIASCNYPARKFGIKNGMWMKTASTLCSTINVLPYDFKLYEDASRHFYDSILAVDGIVQSISIDEALVDVSEQCLKAGLASAKDVSEGPVSREQERAQQLAHDVRKAVREKTGCEVSVGIGNNVLLAKVALRKAKPAGQHLIKPEDVLDFIGELLVTDLPGVAWSIGKKLEEIRIKNVKDIRNTTKERLVNTLGPKTGDKIWDYARGIDRQEVGEQVIRKSVSAEINWGIRFINQQQAEEFVQCLCDELSKRLLEQLVKGKQLTMKIMRKAADAGMDPPKNLGHGKCDTFNKSVVLGVATNDKVIIGKEAISVLRSYGFSPGELRGLGVQMQKLEPLKPAQTATAVAAFDSSQRRLQFKKPATPSRVPKDEVALTRTPASAERQVGPKLMEGSDPIEDIAGYEGVTKGQGSIAAALKQSDNIAANQINRPLNIAGTQFVLPSQIDPTVLAELPTEIRDRLAPKQRSIAKEIRSSSAAHVANSRSSSPQTADGGYAFPNQSQLDPATLAELPEDVKAELLAHYKSNAHLDVKKEQQVLPQSPQKSKPGGTRTKLAITPTKNQKFSSISTKGRIKTINEGSSTLTQSNFVSMAKASVKDTDAGVDADISKSFLDELPEDIRNEILAEQKRQRMRSKGGLNLGTKRKRLPAPAADVLRDQKTIQLPRVAMKPTFTSRKLSTLPELRNAMDAWVKEFSEDGEEGPYPEDIDALSRYLVSVVKDEGDMEKAVAVIKWLLLVIEMQNFEVGHLQSTWHQAIWSLQESVQAAVRVRGLPPIDFG